MKQPLYGISFVEVDTQPLQQAISNKAHKDYLSNLKQNIAYNATIGYDYAEVDFIDLGNILAEDYAFNPFKFKHIDEGAVVNREAYPNPYGRIRGRANVTGQCSWICLDVDKTDVKDIDLHNILLGVNHHIARTSDKYNPRKYRVILPLSTPITITNDEWKFFIKSISNDIGIISDSIPRSQLLIGYKTREVLSTIDGLSIDPSTHLKWAQTQVALIEEKRANAIPKGDADKALAKPYSTFNFAYDAAAGEGTNAMLGAIAKAKDLGASPEYIRDLLKAINNFWDKPMPANRLAATVMTAI